VDDIAHLLDLLMGTCRGLGVDEGDQLEAPSSCQGTFDPIDGDRLSPGDFDRLDLGAMASRHLGDAPAENSVDPDQNSIPTRFAMDASIPAEPVPGIARVNSLEVHITWRRRERVSSMISR